MSSDTLRTILREIAREEAKAAVAEEFAALLSRELPQAKAQSLVSDIRHGMTIYEAADKYGRTAAAIRDRLYHGKWGLLRHDRRPENSFTSPQQLL